MQSMMASGLDDGLTSFALSPFMLSGVLSGILLLIMVALLMSANQGAAMEPAR